MTFIYPLGLLGLIGIPILIIIYIIKNKYTEQTIASTYLWTLSEKFLKRKNPINKLAGLISLILQILIVAALSFGMAHPIIILPGAAHEYCFILDASGSMNMVMDETTRFERGKEEIATIIEDSLDGSYYTLVCVGENTTVVYEKEADKEVALEKLEKTESGYSVADFTKAIQTAQVFFEENASLKTYLVTDKSYENSVNVDVINVSGGEENYAVTDVAHELNGTQLTVSGKAVSYESDMELTVELYIDDAETPVKEVTVQSKKLAFTPFTIETVVAEEGYMSIRVKVKEADALLADNEVTVFSSKMENSYKTLLVSDKPFFVSSALKTVGNPQLTCWTEEEYSEAYLNGTSSGFGLYIFDSVTPQSLPQDGAVWFINVTGNVQGAGFTAQSEVEVEDGAKLEMSTSSATIVKNLTEYVAGDNLYVSHYIKCGVYRNFTNLFTYKGNPVIFTGTNDYGNREVVFAFSLSNSNFATGGAFTTLLSNLLDYSFPEVVEKVSYSVGEKLEINVLANCTGIKVTTPSNTEEYMDSNVEISEYVLEEVGVYTVTLTVGGSDRHFYVYSSVPEEERAPSATAASVEVLGEPGGGGLDGRYDTLIIIFIALAILFIADWGVYCYDKYQLR